MMYLKQAIILNKKGFLVTVDIEKTFDSVNHSFLLAALQNYGFGEFSKMDSNSNEKSKILA